jgi:hypothetical protein
MNKPKKQGLLMEEVTPIHGSGEFSTGIPQFKFHSSPAMITGADVLLLA